VTFTAAEAAARDPNASERTVQDASKLFLKSLQLHPGSFRLLPPAPILIAQFLVQRGGPFERVADLVNAGFAETDRVVAREHSDLDDVNSATLEHLRNSWYASGYLSLAEAYIHLGNLHEANDTLLNAGSKLEAVRPAAAASSMEKASFAELAGQYWFVRGLYAESDHRNADALVDYRNALSLFPLPGPSPDRREAAVDCAKRLWKKLGGTAQGWSDWAEVNPLTTISKGNREGSSWSRLAKSQPHLSFKDTLGKSWTPADLANRTTFVVLWASWCGGCRAELPYLEKLYQRFHDRDDVAILALNIDDDPSAMNEALDQLKVSIPSVVARDFAYALVSETGLPANWLVTPRKTEMFFGNDRSHRRWLEEATAAIEQAAAR